MNASMILPDFTTGAFRYGRNQRRVVRTKRGHGTDPIAQQETTMFVGGAPAPDHSPAQTLVLQPGAGEAGPDDLGWGCSDEKLGLCDLLNAVMVLLGVLGGARVLNMAAYAMLGG